jgi:hypothetical protein
VAATAEDPGLDLRDVVLQSGHDRLVVVDDLVDDRPHDGCRAQLDQLGPGLEP